MAWNGFDLHVEVEEEFAALMSWAGWLPSGYTILNSEKQIEKQRLRTKMWSWRNHKPRVVSHPEGSTYPGTEWTVLRELPPVYSGKQAVRVFDCRCNRCGLETHVHLANLRTGKSKMCRKCGAKDFRMRTKKDLPNLTKPQLRELRCLAKEPQPTFGKFRVRVQNCLVEKGFATVVSDGDRCEITEAGRAELAKAPDAR